MLGAPRRVPCLLHEPRAEGLRLQGVDRDARGQAEHRAVGVDNVEAGRPQAGERRAEPRDRARRLDARREPRRSPGNTHAAAERQQRDEALLLPRKLVGDAIPTDPEPTEERDANRRGIPARRRFVRRCTARPVGDPRVAGARVAGRFALAHRNAGERGAQPVEQVVQATPGTGAVVAGLAVPQQLGCPGRDRDVLTLPLQYVLGNATRGHLGEARAVCMPAPRRPPRPARPEWGCPRACVLPGGRYCPAYRSGVQSSPCVASIGVRTFAYWRIVTGKRTSIARQAATTAWL